MIRRLNYNKCTHRRITREVDSETLHSYYNDAWRPVEERKDAETTAFISYLWGTRHRDDLVRRDRATSGTTLNETRYVLMDYFNPAAITDAVGEVKERYAFSAFGVRTILNPDFTVRSDSECAMEFAFQGQFLDTESGLMNYGYRYYSPRLGRWTCKDPIDEDGGHNLYADSYNDAINKVDLFGLLDRIDVLGNMAAQNAYRKSVNSNPEQNKRIEFCGAICLCVATNALQTTGPFPGTDSHCPKQSCPDGWKKVGSYHSHPDNCPTSYEDYGLLEGAERGYVGTESGTYSMVSAPNEQGILTPYGMKITPQGTTEKHPPLVNNPTNHPGGEVYYPVTPRKY